MTSPQLPRAYLYRLSIICLKYLPVLCAAIMVVHSSLSLFGHRYIFEPILASDSFFHYVMLIIFSRAFRFCWLHRAFITYNFAFSLLIDYNRTLGIREPYLTAIITLSILTGLALFAALTRQRGIRCLK